jgi:hypothetical protein
MGTDEAGSGVVCHGRVVVGAVALISSPNHGSDVQEHVRKRDPRVHNFSDAGHGLAIQHPRLYRPAVDGRPSDGGGSRPQMCRHHHGSLWEQAVSSRELQRVLRLVDRRPHPLPGRREDPTRSPGARAMVREAAVTASGRPGARRIITRPCGDPARSRARAPGSNMQRR